MRKNGAIDELDNMIELKTISFKEPPGRKTNSGLKEPLLGGSNAIRQSHGGGGPLNDDPSKAGLFGAIAKKIHIMTHGPDVSTDSRNIKFDGKVLPPNHFENIVKNQKYSLWTFVPIVLYDQFKFVFNLFYLGISMSQFVPILKIGIRKSVYPKPKGLFFTYIGPLAFVLIMTMLKEAYDDYQRYKRDKEANSMLYKYISSNPLNNRVFKSPTKMEDMPSSSLQVGQIIEVNANQRIPADLILLWTSDPSDTVFIRTDQLDGETDWKLRKPIKYTQNHYKSEKPLYGLRGGVICEPPNQQIYHFEGVFQVEQEGYKESLSLENTMWANTVLASGKILGLVAYTGKETRMAMNSKTPRTKVSQLDVELNYFAKLLFIFMVALSAVLVAINGFTSGWFIQYFKYILLLSSIIPISLRINLDFSKASFSYLINVDKDIEGTIARNSTIPEELGRVEYLLSDKTGTLTQNDMVFKRLSLESIQFTDETLKYLHRILKKQCGKSVGPAEDVAKKIKEQAQEISTNRLGLGPKKRKAFKRDKQVVVRDLVTALVLCHNVTPTMDGNVKSYQASSPDEIALVKIAESVNMELIERTQKTMKIQNAAGVKENYEILQNFPFTSESKRMGIVLRHIETGRIIFYLKGADTIMKYKIPEYQRGWVQDEVDDLAKIGLRTLIISQKYLLEEEYEEWEKKYQDALNTMVNREATCRHVIDQLEQDMEFLGITGVEDKLQEDVAATIENLRDAGIRVWMLTGDKVETATCIAISAGFKSKYQEFYVMRDMTDPIEIQNNLASFNKKTMAVLIIDGGTLHFALQYHEKYFFQVAGEAPAVVCCRCSPTQKADVTNGIKKFLQKKTLGIGDGGNDVGMIQAADVGVGIVGKEGKQAALAADYSILKFKYVKPLLLWHGRNAYKRTAVMSQFVIQRGLIISIMQAVFSVMFYTVAAMAFNGWLMLCYVTVYTMFPVFCLVNQLDNLILPRSLIMMLLKKWR